jgi:60 kDa SS-A/Ro ribonucleoprotein
MAKLNTKQNTSTGLKTHEGAPAKNINAEAMLRRSTMAALLWENEFYEDGVEISKRVADLIPSVDPKKVAAIAVEAREKMKLRHMPLFLVREMARHDTHRTFVADTLATVIQRADELAEFVAIYWKGKKQPLSAQVKKGLAKAFTKFDEYQLSKWNRDGAVKLRDVLFLCHAKPENKAQEKLWKKLIDGKLEIPDTWETSLSMGKDKKETWERLLSENRLGAMALLRNLRNMREVKVPRAKIVEALGKANLARVLPFRFIAAARYAPELEPDIEKALFKCVADKPKLTGHTVILADVSGSMDSQISVKSEMKRDDAGYGIAMLAREMCESVSVYTFSGECKIVPARRGFALRDAMRNSQMHGSTYLGKAMTHIHTNEKYDRIIVITDEQSHDAVPNPSGRGYVINVASNRNGVGYGKWLHIDGWSEAVLDYIVEYEKNFKN